MHKLVLLVSILALLSLPLHAAVKAEPAKLDLLDTLPSKPIEPLAPEMRPLIAGLKKNPEDVELALQLARAYYQQAVREGELRFVGYAHALLSPWATREAPPIEVLLMRA